MLKYFAATSKKCVNIRFVIYFIAEHKYKKNIIQSTCTVKLLLTKINKPSISILI